jgi:hypothetical protein
MNDGGQSRSIPVSVRLQALFAGPSNQLGWFFFGFGMVFFWLFVCRADLTSWYRFRDPLQTVQGRVTGSSKTGATEGGRRSRGTPIYKNEFAYFVDGNQYRGISYATGVGPRAGTAITVEFAPGRPNIARIRGMRTNVFPGMVLFVTIFPLAGLGIVLSGLRRGFKACAFLANGVLTSGKLTLKSATNVRVNNRPVYKFAFVFTTQRGEVCTAETKTAAARFENDSPEPVLYDPTEPQQAVLLNDLPGAPQIDETGRVFNRKPAAVVTSCLIPTITVLGHSYWAAYLLTH